MRRFLLYANLSGHDAPIPPLCDTAPVMHTPAAGTIVPVSILQQVAQLRPCNYYKGWEHGELVMGRDDDRRSPRPALEWLAGDNRDATGSAGKMG